jgi:hypothetical protein
MMPRSMMMSVLSVTVALVTTVPAQQKNAPTSRLSALDYVQIQQLVARHDYALNTGAQDGYMFADLFAVDGEIATPRTQGREQLAAFARGRVKDQATAHIRDFVTNVVITPAAEGATGKAYMVAFDIGVAGKPSVVMNGGRYDDVYVKTADGWRFKRRTLIAKKAGAGD